MSDRLRARFLVLAAAALFSTGAAAIKATTLTAWQVAGFRSGVAALVLGLVLWRRGQLLRLAAVRWVGLAYAAALTGYVVANKLTTAANTIFLVSTAPLWVVILSPWLLKERPAPRDLALLALVAGGMALVFAAPTPALATALDPPLGNRIAAGSALFWALTLIGLRRLSREQSPKGAAGDGSTALAAVVWGNVLAFLLCLPLALPVTAVSGGDLAAIGYLGAVQIGVAYLLLVAGMRRVPAIEVSLLLLLEPVLNPLWAWLLHREAASVGALAGGAVIVTALGLEVWFGARRRDVAAAPPGGVGPD